MRILVLDTIHGGTILGEALRKEGHQVDLVDVYRGSLTAPGSITRAEAGSGTYDLLIHPVHLDPADHLLRTLPFPSITHHEAVRWILNTRMKEPGNGRGPVIEITGTRGKTTTATALASLLPGRGILHTSRGTFRYPDQELITRMSITPASLITATSLLHPGDWFIGEVSLGMTGIADLGILTSDEDYRVASGRLSARAIKQASCMRCSRILLPPGVDIPHDHAERADEYGTISGTRYIWQEQGREETLENPLLVSPGYKTPLMLAAAAARILGLSPAGLTRCTAIPGRLRIIKEGEKTIIDNASSGACLTTTLDAIRMAGMQNHPGGFTLVIGQEERAVCENFPVPDIITAVRQGPAAIILIAGDERMDTDSIFRTCRTQNIPYRTAASLADGIAAAKNLPSRVIVVSVKTWR